MAFKRFSHQRILNILMISLALSAGAPGTAWAELGPVLRSRLARFLVTESEAGSAFVRKLLGQQFRATSQLDDVIALLGKGEAQALSTELEARLLHLEGKFRKARGLPANEAIVKLSAADKRLLAELADDFFRIRAGEGIRLELAQPRDTQFMAARDAFLRGEINRVPFRMPVTAEEIRAFKEYYRVNPEQVLFTPKNKWPGIIKGLPGQRPMTPEIKGPILEHPGMQPDVVVIGTGIAGDTATLELSDQGLKVLGLEAADRFGGVAVGNKIGAADIGGGGAYYSGPGGFQFRLMQRLGLNNYTKINKIKKNIDSLYLDGKLHPEFWESEALYDLEASFELYKHFVERMGNKDFIPDQPIELGELWLDQYTAKQVVEMIPEMVSKWKDPTSRRIYKKFLEDPRIDRANPMKQLYSYLDPYTRSALGTTTDEINALVFFNFQKSEIVHRFTGQMGTGEFTERFMKLFAQRQDLVQFQASSPVAKIIQHADHVEVIYVRNGQAYSVKAKDVVFTAPMKIAPKVIEGFERIAPEHAAALKKIPYSDHLVTNVETEGQVTKGTYDFWFGNTNNAALETTDMINARFQQYGNHKVDDGIGVLNFYRHVGNDYFRNLTPAEIMAEAEKSIMQAQEMMGPYIKATWGTEIQPKFVIANVYPASIHVVKPNYFRDIAPIFRKPIGESIYPAGIVNGAPSVEEAIYSGHRAAEEIIRKTLARRARP